ncbi:MAG: DUF2805 domain-containing protein [Pelomonas sp.]|nr:DUF2805 domain-containing protein [Roseateles sp.]
MAKTIPRLTREQTDAVVRTAWEDAPPYRRVSLEHGLSEGELVQLMKRELTSSAYKQWAAQGKATKKPTSKATFPYGR